jgi:hypothetical protein
MRGLKGGRSLAARVFLRAAAICTAKWRKNDREGESRDKLAAARKTLEQALMISMNAPRAISCFS